MAARRIDPDEVRRIARLAHIELEEREADQLSLQLGGILSRFEQLQELDTEGVEPTAHLLDLVNALREDEPRTSLPRESALSSAPESESDHFKVPPVI